MRIVQGIGGAFLFANSAAILTDAFPTHQRGLALGINGIAAIAGQFIGLLAGGFLATIEWRLVFFVSVPIGIIGTIWAYLRLEELSTTSHTRMDWAGNLTFGIGLAAILIGITYGIQPYGSDPTGWTSPLVIGLIGGGLVLLAAFLWLERRVRDPFFDLSLFRIRAFMAGNVAGLLASTGRGGLSFMLVIWLQGIWLPLHGYSYADTPLWAGIYMLPLTVGFLVAGPLSGFLSDRFGARPFATGGHAPGRRRLHRADPPAGRSSPIPCSPCLLLLAGVGSGLFNSPNAAAIMNSVPAGQRGAASGMRAVFANAGFVVSIGLFFSLMIARPGRLAAVDALRRPRGPRRPRVGRAPRSRTSRRSRACSPPCWATTRWPRCCRRASSTPCRPTRPLSSPARTSSPSSSAARSSRA